MFSPCSESPLGGVRSRFRQIHLVRGVRFPPISERSVSALVFALAGRGEPVSLLIIQGSRPLSVGRVLFPSCYQGSSLALFRELLQSLSDGLSGPPRSPGTSAPLRCAERLLWRFKGSLRACRGV